MSSGWKVTALQVERMGEADCLVSVTVSHPEHGRRERVLTADDVAALTARGVVSFDLRDLPALLSKVTT